MTALSVVIPCYNEAERLPATLAVYLAHLSRAAGEVEVLIVDDGSTDATLAVADAAAGGDARVRVIRTQPNRGKGFAVRTGMLAAEGDRVVFTDADGSYGPGELDRVTRALADAPVAIGSRDPDDAAGSVIRRVASLVFNLAMRVLLGLPFRDTQCGLKGFRRDAARRCSAAPGWTASPSTPRHWCWPGGWVWRSPRFRCARSNVPAARCGCLPMGGACSPSSGGSGGLRAATTPTPSRSRALSTHVPPSLARMGPSPRRPGQAHRQL